MWSPQRIVNVKTLKFFFFFGTELFFQNILETRSLSGPEGVVRNYACHFLFFFFSKNFLFEIKFCPRGVLLLTWLKIWLCRWISISMHKSPSFKITKLRLEFFWYDRKRKVFFCRTDAVFILYKSFSFLFELKKKSFLFCLVKRSNVFSKLFFNSLIRVKTYVRLLIDVQLLVFQKKCFNLSGTC